MIKKIISIILVLILSVFQISPSLAEASASATVESGLTNVALNKTVTIKQGRSCDGDVTNLVDGNIYTYAGAIEDNSDVYNSWIAGSDGAGFVIDLGNTYSISEINLYAVGGNDSGRNQIWIDYSLNNSDWTNIYARNNDITDGFSKENKTEDMLTINSFGTVSARYVRVYSFTYALWEEIEIFGKLQSQDVEVEGVLTNVALNKSIEFGASGGKTSAQWYKEYLVNGDTQYEFVELMSDGDQMPSLVIDLGAEYLVSELMLYARSDNAGGRDNIKLDYSTDNTIWTNLLTREVATDADDFASGVMKSHVLTVNNFGTVSARYVQISAPYGVWCELEVYATLPYPKLVDTTISGKTITTEFSEKLLDSSVTEDSFKVYANDKLLTSGVDYTVSVNEKNIIATLAKNYYDTTFMVEASTAVKSADGVALLSIASDTVASPLSMADVQGEMVNVALNKTVSITTGTSADETVKESINDGDTGTFASVLWDGENTDVGFVIDLGAEYLISEIKIHALETNDSGRNQIWVDYSLDNSDWTNIYARNNDITDGFSSANKTEHILTVDDFGNVSARYIKVYSWAYTVWSEIEVYSKLPQLIDVERLNEKIYLEFNDEINVSTINPETLLVYAEGQAVNYSAMADKNTVILTLDNVVDAEYSVQLTSGIKNIDGSSMITLGEKIPVVSMFSTSEISINTSLTNATASVTIENTSEDLKKISFILAQYSSTGMLENIDISTKELNSATTEAFEAVINSSTGFDTNTVFKVFVWNVTDGKMIPVTLPEEYIGMITELYVSPKGSDDANGTLDSPFATIERAMAEVNNYNTDMNHDITVYLMEGVYQLDNTLVFDENDGGTNGYDVIYKAYPGDEAVISGGVPVTEWTEGENGIWYADVTGIDSALVMSVDGVAARRAQSEEWIDIDTLFPEERSEDTVAGLTVADTKYAGYTNKSDIQLKFSRGWKSYLLNVDDITVDGTSSKFVMRQPTYYYAEYNKLNDDGYETHFYNIEDNNNFKIENAFEELDTQGEFYYNNNRVYYMPREGEDLKNADVRIAKLDKLIEIDGFDNANKVSNLVFEDLIFSDGAWSRASEYGFVSDQAQILVFDPEVSTVNPGYTLSPGSILVNRAENITFKNNVIRNMGAGGIYFYKGVDNSNIVGNAFYDLGDSAVAVSSPDQVYNETAYVGKNLAAGKLAKAGSITGEYYTPDRAFDTNTSTIWAPRLNGDSWIQVDLEDAYEIDRIELDYRTDGGHKSFDGVIILASNDPEFENNYTQLTTTVTSTDTGVIHTISDIEKYRYVRFKHTSDTGYWVLPEARIINESMDYVSSTDICDNNLINNNYITRVGKANMAAPGMQLYYVQDTEISNNYIYEVPYSGIALGWGWSSYKDSDTCGNNSILNNRIDKTMLQSFDGGGIYICGQQYGNSVISGNHITNSINGGGIYLDTYSSNNDINNNVIENVLESFCAPSDSFNNTWSNNYASSVMTTVSNVVDNTFSEPVAFIAGDYTEEATQIVQSAGLTDEYETLAQLAGENLYPLTVAEYYNNMLHDEDNHHILPWYLKKIYNTSFIDSANKWIELATAAGYNSEAIAKLQTAVDDMSDTEERTTIFEQCNTIREAMNEFSQSIK